MNISTSRTEDSLESSSSDRDNPKSSHSSYSTDSSPPSSSPEGQQKKRRGHGHHRSRRDETRVPLKTVLQNFLNHVDRLEAQKGEGDCTYEKEFQQLKAFSDSLKGQPEYSCKEGELEVNRKKNRYKDILPFDATRVLLSEYPGVPGSDYINANYIKGASGSNAYIASQGPLPHTVNDFWRMVVETEVQVIVMACNETEAGKHKCERYWDNSSDSDTEQNCCKDENNSKKKTGEREEIQFGKYFVKVLKMREICPDFSVRTMRLRWANEKGTQEERTVCQFHYSAWPDHGIPTQVKPLLEMVRLIRDCQASETLPVLVHCSAGCGRTGTICAIDFIWGLLRTGKLTSDFSLFELVKDMRRQRVAMVQTVDQYILVHRAVRELFLEQLRVIDAHPYENVDGDGNPLGRRSEDSTPIYEMINIKGDKPDGEKMEKVLSQRMSQPRTVMGTTMLARENSKPSRSGSDPPPKSRNSKESKYPELGPVEELTKGSEPTLYEPAKSSRSRDSSGPHKLKKGQLRLTQTNNGDWKLEELDDSAKQTFEKRTETKKSKKKSNRSENLSGKQQLLRRPSMKKIRDFFQKDKDSGEIKGSPVTDSSEESLQSDSDTAAALSKLPKVELGASPSSLLGAFENSKSVPNSLDQKTSYDPDYANLSGVILNNNNNNTRFFKKEATNTRVYQRRSPSPMKQIRSALSTDRLTGLVGDNNIFRERGRHSTKPSLPIKRSKSMKTMSKPDDIGSLSSFAKKRDRSAVPDRKSESRHFRQSSSDSGSNNPTMNHKNRDYANLKTPDYLDSPRKFEESGFLKAKPQNNYVNINVRRNSKDDNGMSKEEFIEQQLAKLHSKIGKEDANIPEELRQSLPFIVRSSDSLDDRAKEMLKDCQEYLMKSFNIAEREGDRMMIKNNIIKSKNRSAESSPMTTLQKSNSHLFSSHSSPSNSFNKYNNNSNVKSTSSPHGMIQKSVSSPTGTVLKNFCNPAGSGQRSNEKKLSPQSNDPRTHSSMSQSSVSKNMNSTTYANIIPTSSSNFSSNSFASNPPERPKERRNSFKEAVERNKDGKEVPSDFNRDSGPGQLKGYESMMVDKQDTHQAMKSLPSSTGDHSFRPSPRSADNAYENVIKTTPQRAEPQANHNFPGKSRRTDQLQKKYYTTTDNGYEPVFFQNNKFSQNQDHQLQSVSLVNAVSRNRNGKPSMPDSIPRQFSSGSLSKFQQPPPYKEPPQPTQRSSKPTEGYVSSTSNTRSSKIQLTSRNEPMFSKKSSGDANAYVNVSVNQRPSRESDRTSKDDMAVTRRNRETKRSSSQARLTSNRLSMGDLGQMAQLSVFDPLKQSSSNKKRGQGLTVKPANVQSSNYISMSGGGEAMASETNNLGVDVDEIGVRMQNNKASDGPPMNLRISEKPLNAIMSNLRSFFPFSSMSSSDLNREQAQSQASSLNPGEQSANAIPLTVPGAAAVTRNEPKQSTCAYPNRLESRPRGPREIPAQFKRQEYI